MTERSAFQRFTGELRRRHVPQTAAIYLVAAWAAIEFADVVVPNLGGPQWVVTAVIVAAAVGLPVVLVLAWIFDWGPEGVYRTSDRADAGDETGREAPVGARGRSTASPWLVAVAVLVVGIASALAVAALLGPNGESVAENDPTPLDSPERPGRQPELMPGGGLIDPDSIRDRLARDIEQVRGFSGLSRLEGLGGLDRLSEMDSMEVDELLEVVAEAADEAGVAVFLQEPAAWRLGRGAPATLAAGDTLVVAGLARDTAGVASVSVDGSVVARADGPEPNLRFTGRVVGDRAAGSRPVAIVVRTADGREIRREYPLIHVPSTRAPDRSP